MILYEIAALLIVVASFKIFGGYGIVGLLVLILAWQVAYKVKYGYWMEGVDH